MIFHRRRPIVFEAFCHFLIIAPAARPTFNLRDYFMTTDRERLLAMLNALGASETALRRDPPFRGQADTGDWAIWGRDDNDDSDIPIGMSCHVYPDGDGYLIYFASAK